MNKCNLKSYFTMILSIGTLAITNVSAESKRSLDDSDIICSSPMRDLDTKPTSFDDMTPIVCSKLFNEDEYKKIVKENDKLKSEIELLENDIKKIEDSEKEKKRLLIASSSGIPSPPPPPPPPLAPAGPGVAPPPPPLMGGTKRLTYAEKRVIDFEKNKGSANYLMVESPPAGFVNDRGLFDKLRNEFSNLLGKDNIPKELRKESRIARDEDLNKMLNHYSAAELYSIYKLHSDTLEDSLKRKYKTTGVDREEAEDNKKFIKRAVANVKDKIRTLDPIVEKLGKRDLLNAQENVVKNKQSWVNFFDNAKGSSLVEIEKLIKSREKNNQLALSQNELLNKFAISENAKANRNKGPAKALKINSRPAMDPDEIKKMYENLKQKRKDNPSGFNTPKKKSSVEKHPLYDILKKRRKGIVGDDED